MPPNQTPEENSGNIRRSAMTPTPHAFPNQISEQVVVQHQQNSLEDAVCQVLRTSQVPLTAPLMQPSLVVTSINPLSPSITFIDARDLSRYQLIRNAAQNVVLQDGTVITSPAAASIHHIQRQLQAIAVAQESSLRLSSADRATSAASNISELTTQNLQLQIAATRRRSIIPMTSQSSTPVAAAVVMAQNQIPQNRSSLTDSNPIPSLCLDGVGRLPSSEVNSSTSSQEALDKQHGDSQCTNSDEEDNIQNRDHRHEESAMNKTAKSCNKKWDIMFDRLLRYKELKGNCMVPQNYRDDTPLASWVNKQRVRERELSGDRVRRLNDIGFVWSVYQSTWDTMVLSLRKFKSKHGHCRVPRKYEENPQLGKWVDNQRVKLRKGRLSQERRQQLDSVGFEY